MCLCLCICICAMLQVCSLYTLSLFLSLSFSLSLSLSLSLKHIFIHTCMCACIYKTHIITHTQTHVQSISSKVVNLCLNTNRLLLRRGHSQKAEGCPACRRTQGPRKLLCMQARPTCTGIAHLCSGSLHQRIVCDIRVGFLLAFAGLRLFPVCTQTRCKM